MNALYQSIECRHGRPECLCEDNGTWTIIWVPWSDYLLARFQYGFYEVEQKLLPPNWIAV